LIKGLFEKRFLEIRIIRKPKPFERRGLDEKVGSFVYLDFASVGFGFMYDGIKV
jgi:hypothetical protein